MKKKYEFLKKLFYGLLAELWGTALVFLLIFTLASIATFIITANITEAITVGFAVAMFTLAFMHG